MGRDTRLWRALDHLADTVLVGVLALLAALPVVTAPAALAAAGAVLHGPEAGGSLPRRFSGALRARLRVGTQLGVAALALAGVAAVDLAWAVGAPLTVLRTGVLAAGALLLLGSFAVTAAATALLASPVGRRDDDERPCPVTLRPLVGAAAAHAAVAPHRFLAALLLSLLGGAAGFALPVLTPLLLGVAARWLPHLRVRALTTAAPPERVDVR